MSKELDWIQVGDLAKGYVGGHMLPENSDLAGRTIELNYEDMGVTRYSFNDNNVLEWKIVDGKEKGTCGEETFRATCLRGGFYFVDFIAQTPRATTVGLVLNFAAKLATVVVGTMPTKEETQKDMYRRANEGLELTAVKVQFLRAGIGRKILPGEGKHQLTSDMVGKRVKYVYSDSETYEHIYLNENLYTWHCLAGAEKGLADTDCCRHIKIDDDVYLFSWWEKIIPTLGVLLVDLKEFRNTGKIFGYESDDFTTLTNAPVGAFGTLLNLTKYE